MTRFKSKNLIFSQTKLVTLTFPIIKLKLLISLRNKFMASKLTKRISPHLYIIYNMHMQTLYKKES